MILTRKKNISRTLQILITILMISFSGCAIKQPSPLSLEETYNKFKSDYGSCDYSGVMLKASIYSFSRGRGHRTTVQVWGENESPLRLDVRAGIGAFLAHIRQDKFGLTAYYPKDETVYLHHDTVIGAQMLGLPLPFDLIKLARMMSGCFHGMLPESFDSAEQQTLSGYFIFSFNTGPIASITTTSDGRPVSIAGRDYTGWELSFSSFETADNGRELPDMLNLVTADGDKAILRIKSREFKKIPWPEKALELRIPEDTSTVRLDADSYIPVPAQN